MDRALNENELRVLAALDDEFVSTSVLKVRAGYSVRIRNGHLLDACVELERRGLAERISPNCLLKPRWRRSVATPPRHHFPTGHCDALVED